MHIDVRAIPSFEVKKRALLNHDNIVVPTEGIPSQAHKPMAASIWVRHQMTDSSFKLTAGG
jgi:hypothetical protein